MSFNTPVLFIVFNRFEQTKRVFEVIKKQSPRKLFISSDGPRNELEGSKVSQIRDYILSQIDWECEIFTKFNECNLGCNLGPGTAISWFFSIVSQGIILEDDCLPDESFFTFCSHYLEKFEHDKRVFHIAGNNLLGDYQTNFECNDILFSKYNFVWGWATWSDRWNYYDASLNSYESDEFINNIFPNTKDQFFWKDIFSRVKSGELDSCWDYQWTFACWKNEGLSLVSSKNLVQNIGFTLDATHTYNPNPFIENLKTYNWKPSNDFFLKLEVDEIFDDKIQGKFFRQNLYIRIILKLYKIFRYKK